MSKTIDELEREVNRLQHELFALKQQGTISESRRVELREGEDLQARTTARLRRLAGLPPETNKQSKSELANVEESVKSNPLFRRALKLFNGNVAAAEGFVARAHQRRK